VETELGNSGLLGNNGRTTINLAPADVKKEGPSFDLPIALGILAAVGEFEHAAIADICVVGELALSGEVRRVKGVLPMALQARRQGMSFDSGGNKMIYDPAATKEALEVANKFLNRYVRN